MRAAPSEQRAGVPDHLAHPLDKPAGEIRAYVRRESQEPCERVPAPGRAAPADTGRRTATSTLGDLLADALERDGTADIAHALADKESGIPRCPGLGRHVG